MNILLIFAGVFLSGILLVNVLKKYLPGSFYIPYIYLLGSFVSLPVIYLLRSYLLSNLQGSIYVWLFIILIFFFISSRLNLSFNELFTVKLKYFVFLLLLSFFYIIFNKAFSYDNFNFLISTNMYLDMGAHIPFIRSFSNDVNFPFQIPFYANSNIPYHFMFDFYAGLLEYSGLRIDVAYNTISALTFSSLVFVLMDFGKAVFNKKYIGILAAVIFFLPFNFSFFSAIRESPLAVWRTQAYDFSSFLGEYTAGNFLYLNVYINQRHLIFALSLTLIFTMVALKIIEFKKNNTILTLFYGLMLSIMYFWNVPIFISCALLIALYLSIYRAWKTLFVFTASCMVFTFLFFLPNMDSKTTNIQFLPGYLMHASLTLPRFLVFWVINIGFTLIAIIGGFFISNKKQKVLFLCLLIIFLIPNLFKFSQDMFDNHKFFNLVYLFMSFYAAYFLWYLYKKNIYLRVTALFLFILTIFTSLSNVAVIKNDIYATIPDYKNYSIFKFMKKTIDKKNITLTNGEIYDPSSIVGIKTYIGRPHYVYLYGGDPAKRSQNRILYLNTKKLPTAGEIQYIITYKDKRVKNLLEINKVFLKKNYKIIYEDEFGVIYKI